MRRVGRSERNRSKLPDRLLEVGEEREGEQEVGPGAEEGEEGEVMGVLEPEEGRTL